MEVVVFLLIFVAVVWFVGNPVGWLATRNSGLFQEHPFNWRIWLGPIAYCNWLDRRDTSNTAYKSL